MSGARGEPVETFSRSWLELREPVDHRSRSHAILTPLQEAWAHRGWSRVLDLGSGTGSNLRYLAPRLGGRQEWTLLDHDARLLDRARKWEEPGEGLTRLRTVTGDLAREGLAQVVHAHLVTASALLDLVGESWLKELVTACRDRRAGALFALSYDGSARWEPAESIDQEVVHAVNLHQGRDKGLGAALGAQAARTAENLFRQAGYTTWLQPAPWILGPGDRALAQELTAGWVRAAGEAVPERAEAFRRWGEDRLQSTESERFTLTVGHWDLLALPPLPPVPFLGESGPALEESGPPPPSGTRS